MKFNEEEKEAVEILESWKNYNIKNKNKLLKADEIIEIQETILTLISKLQKEIENSISKDKIRNLLKELDKKKKKGMLPYEADRYVKELLGGDKE